MKEGIRKIHLKEVQRMKKTILILPLLGLVLSGCGLNETMRAMECNTIAINHSTCVIRENAVTIEQATRDIEENRRQIQAVNKRLDEMNKE